MKSSSSTWRDYLIPLWLILVSLCLLQGSLIDFRRDRAMEVLVDYISSLRSQLRASKSLIWHIHGPQAMKEADFENEEVK